MARKKKGGKKKMKAALAAALAAAAAAEEEVKISNNDATPPPPDTVPEPDYDYKNDPRPASSPYTEAVCYLLVGPKLIRYTVPTNYLKKSPHLISRLPLSLGSRTIELPELNEDIGHTLVHFLYTGEYQTLKRPVSSNAERKSTEYKRSVLVYQAASAYGLPLLLKRAKTKIRKFNGAVSIFETLDIAKLVYEKLQDGDEVWFYSYLKRKFEDAFDADETLFAQDRFRGYIGEAPTFSRMLVKLLVEIYSDRLSRTRIKNDRAGTYEVEQPACYGELAEESPVVEYPEPEPEDDCVLNYPEPEPEEGCVIECPEPVPQDASSLESVSPGEDSPSVEVAWHGVEESPTEKDITAESDPVMYADEDQPADAAPEEYDFLGFPKTRISARNNREVVVE